MKRKVLNEIYGPMIKKFDEFIFKLGEKSIWGFFNNHYHKNNEGKYVPDSFPIPVITVNGLCDIEIDVDKISVTSKLTKENALKLDYSVFKGLCFEIYGVEDYLWDYFDGVDINKALQDLKCSSETELFLSFSFDINVLSEEILHLIEILKSNDFYY